MIATVFWLHLYTVGKMVMNCLVLAKVTEILSTNICYPCCQQCNSKIFQVEKGWSCSKCSNQVSSSALHHRYRLSLTICDSKSQCSVTVFGTTLDSFIGCPADTLHKWLQETRHNEDSLKASLDDTFTGHMFLFGFKVKTLRKATTAAKCVPLSLDDVGKLSTISEDTKSKSASLIAYQMLHPNDIIQQDSQTLFEKLKYSRLVALGRVPTRDFICPWNDRDSFIQQKSYPNSGSSHKSICDDQDTIQLSCGSFTRTTFDFSSNDSSHENKSSRSSNFGIHKNDSDIEFDSQPSIELPRTSKLSFSSSHLDYQCEANDVTAITEQLQEDENSMHQKLLNDESTFDRSKHLNMESGPEVTEVPVFRFCMREEESISDSILLQANDIEFSDGHNPEIPYKEKTCNQSTTEPVQQNWTCIPESEELGEFLDQFQSEVNHSTASHVSNKVCHGKSKILSNSRCESNPSVTCYPMSEDLDAFLSDAAESMHEGWEEEDAESVGNEVSKDRNSITRAENKVMRESNEITRDENEITKDENEVASDENEITRDENEIKREQNEITTDENEVTRDENEITREENEVTREGSITEHSKHTTIIPESEEMEISHSTSKSDSPSPANLELPSTAKVHIPKANTLRIETANDSGSTTKLESSSTAKSHFPSSICTEPANESYKTVAGHVTPTTVLKSEIDFDDNLWDDDVLSQNLLNAMNDLDIQSTIAHDIDQNNVSCVIVESEDMFSSFNQGQGSERPTHNDHPCANTPVSGPTVILDSASIKKGVRFAKSLLQSQTVAHIDHLMLTTPISLPPMSRRSSCLKVKPSKDIIASPCCPGTPDLSQDLFSPSPISSNATRSCNRSLVKVPTKCLYQSTPTHKTDSLKQVSSSRSHVSESTAQSDDLTDSMDLFSDSSYSASCTKSRNRNTSHSQDLFSDESFDEDGHYELCKKLF